jgi:uncharacterized protein YecE (DUF72 family)
MNDPRILPSRKVRRRRHTARKEELLRLQAGGRDPRTDRIPVTNPALALLRLHGRNHGARNRKGLTLSSQRFNCDYSEVELQGLVPEVTSPARKAELEHVLSNTNYRDQQRAAKSMTRPLGADTPEP